MMQKYAVQHAGLSNGDQIKIKRSVMGDFIERKASKSSISRRGLVCGVGINDAWYITRSDINGRTVKCPFYKKWSSMLNRCYSEKCQNKQSTYKGCTVCDEWLTFSNFKSWMIKQEWKGNALDKDILIQGNKIYSPETCLFVSQSINNLMSYDKETNGAYPKGVTHHKGAGKFAARFGLNGEKKYLGLFETKDIAYQAYKEHKLNHIKAIAENQKEPLKSALLRWVIT